MIQNRVKGSGGMPQLRGQFFYRLPNKVVVFFFMLGQIFLVTRQDVLLREWQVCGVTRSSVELS